MRRLLIALLIITGLLAALGVAGCGGAAQTAGLSPGGPSNLSPEGILAAAVAASKDMESARGSFEFTISFDLDVDTSEMPQEALGLMGQPMVMAGTFAYGYDPQAVEFGLSADLFGQTMDMGMKLLDDQAWFRFLDQWYEAPAEMQELMGDYNAQEAQAAELEKMLSEAGIDPMTWMNDLTLVGEESLDGIAVYHLSASPNMAKMMTDLITLMQSEQFMGLLDPTGSAGDLMGTGMLMPGAEELQEMQDQLASMFEELTADLWIAQENSVLRKAAIGARMVPPPGEDADGVNGIDLAATMLFLEVNQPVTVEPPASALPWSEFEKAIQENPEMFMGGLMGAFGAAAPQTY